MDFPLHRRPVLLELDLTSMPAEPEADDPLSRLLSRGRRLLRPVLRTLHEAGDDARVGGLVIKVGGALPWAGMQELRAGLSAFAASGKPTYAWAESFSEGPGEMAAYVLASAARTIWLQPGGGVGLLGVGLETTFLRGALDKLGVEPELEQRHEYKNAVDRLARREFTPAHRESLQRLADSTVEVAVAQIAADRGLAPERVRELIDTGPRTAGEALEVGLVDTLGYRDEVYAAIRRELMAADGDAADPERGVELLFADRWRRPRRVSLPRPRGHVALVEARGGITAGRSRRGPMGRQLGSDSVSAQLRAAAADDHAKAVVLAIDSPGGSAVASEVIWREVGRVRAAGKPVVVSMGGVAASGGYYIACPADVIVALPATLTGSIGVFGGKFVVRELLDKLGLGTGAVQQGERALMYSARQPFSEAERERMAHAIDTIYADFVGKVAAGRSRSFEEIDAIAKGRVWTGADAKRVGLVDELGGLREAVRIARLRAGLADHAPVRPAVATSLVDRFAQPRNSEDPRALAGVSAVAAVGEAAHELRSLDLRAWGLTPGFELRMPDIALR